MFMCIFLVLFNQESNTTIDIKSVRARVCASFFAPFLLLQKDMVCYLRFDIKLRGRHRLASSVYKMKPSGYSSLSNELFVAKWW